MSHLRHTRVTRTYRDLAHRAHLLLFRRTEREQIVNLLVFLLNHLLHEVDIHRHFFTLSKAPVFVVLTIKTRVVVRRRHLLLFSGGMSSWRVSRLLERELVLRYR